MNESEVCDNEKQHLLHEARLSFLSGHASFSFYCATFLILYMKNKQLWSKIVKIFLFLLATWISITRVTDYYHFPLDVVCGALTGMGFALYFSETEEDSTIIGVNIINDVTL